MGYNYPVYTLQLANGLGWHFISTQEMVSWVEDLASMMRLKKTKLNGYPKIIFIKKKLDKKVCPDCLQDLNLAVRNNLPQKGWRIQDYRLIRIWLHSKVSDFLCEVGDEKGHALNIIKMQLALSPLYQRIQEKGGVSFHSALVGYHGQGILLAGRGGIGKSTCCQRLPLPWRALCDDGTLIVQDNQKKYHLHPFLTWSDYFFRRSKRSWDVQKHLPLKAIFFLEQSKSDGVFPLKQGEAAVFINESALQASLKNWRGLDSREKIAVKGNIFNNACQLAKAVPSFRLRVSLKGRFWEKIEKVLNYG